MAEPRLRALVVVAALVAVPAAALQWRCGPAGCDPPPTPARVPFCGLPEETRRLIVAGYRAGRSPEVLGTTAAGSGVRTSSTPWPSMNDAVAVPLAFVGERIVGRRLPDGVTLDDVAPTLARAAALDRPFPEVRSGTPIPGVLAPGAPARLLVIVAWKGIGAHGAGTRVDDLFPRGAATRRAGTGSVPLDPTAVLTTIGTGGVPAQHGVTGTLVRGEHGVTRAFGPDAPIPVIAGLAEDLDEATGQRARIALVADAPDDRGLVGGDWYPGADRDDVIVDDRHADATVRRLIAAGYGADEVPDLIAVSLEGPVGRLVKLTDAIVTAVGPRAIVAVAGTGDAALPEATPGATVAAGVVADLGAPPTLIEGVAGDGLFLDPSVAAAADVGAARAADALAAQAGPTGGPRFADAAPGFSVALAGYC
ncbi:MAG TPA: hypothetical protein VE032_02810 [Actinomycetota bacterium]|nr:hypothetical protein [Actinomycetota bacterium]